MMPKPSPLPRRLKLAVHADAPLDVALLVAGVATLFDLAQLVACVIIGIALARTDVVLLIAGALGLLLAFALTSLCDYLEDQARQASPWPPAAGETNNAKDAR